MIRLFIALKIPDDIKKQIVTLRSRIINSPLKWEPEEKLHLTLKFIGDVPEDKLEKIIDSVSFINDNKKFNCSLTGFGFFFFQQKGIVKRDEPRILWAGFKTDKSLFELADRLNQHFIMFSIPAEKRKFSAHLTMLRIKNKVDKDFIDAFENYKMDEIPFVADEVALIKSELLPAGSKYTEIKNFILK